MIESKIKVLDKNTANQIAAGEVVERPASVIKELVENSLDAKATFISINIEKGGIEFMKVTDNGIGMGENDLQASVLRHATSKLKKSDDLLKLTSLGFRGEALPSIASVSKFQMISRIEENEFAFKLSIEGGSKPEISKTGAEVGTTSIIEDLFYNVPARRKFLKTPATEGRYINDIITKIALSRPDVRFNFIKNDKEVINTPGNGDVLDTISSLYGKKVSDELIPLNYSDFGIKVTGFVSNPSLLKGNRHWQTLFVNGRSIQNPMISRAIDQAYQSKIPKSGFPFAVINIDIDPATIDINVHPQKSEIKFSEENKVYRVVYHTLLTALTRPMRAEKNIESFESAVFENNNEFVVSKLVTKEKSDDVLPLIKTESVDLFKNDLDATNDSTNIKEVTKVVPKTTDNDLVLKNSRSSVNRYDEFPKVENSIWKTPEPEKTITGKNFEASQKIVGEKNFVSEKNIDNEFLGHEQVNNTKNTGIFSKEENEIKIQTLQNNTDNIWPIGQVDNTFIVAQSKDNLYLIDQHAAHERILYDRLVKINNDIPMQPFLVPIYIEASNDEITLIEEYKNEFLKLGVDVSSGGEEMLRISSLPCDIKADDAEEFIKEILKMLTDMKDISPSDLRQNVLHCAACHAAIKAGEVLNMRQMRNLIMDLFNTENPFTCPHGRPSIQKFTSKDLYKMFKRI